MTEHVFAAALIGGFLGAFAAALFYNLIAARRNRRKMEELMATLDQILEDVTNEAPGIDSLAALIAGLKAQLADALSGVTLPPAVQAKVDAIFAAAETNKQKIADALAADPAAPPETP